MKNPEILKSLNLLSKSLPEEDRKRYKIVMSELINGQRERWSLYQSLHLIGDDPVKSAIENDLKIILNNETYALVEAIFQWNADWDLL